MSDGSPVDRPLGQAIDANLADAMKAIAAVNPEAPAIPQTVEIIAGLPVHAAASLFPMMLGAEFDELVESIRRTRTVTPVETHNGKLIDGRNRCRAVEELKRQGEEIELPTTEWHPQAGETVEERVFALNICRRHLTDDQRAVLATRLLPSIRLSRKERQAASQFGPGGKQAVAQDSAPPHENAAAGRRSSQEKFERSTIGQLAALVNVPRHKATQAATLSDGVASGEIPQEDFDRVVAGEIRLRDALPTRKRRSSQRNCRDAGAEADDGRDLKCVVGGDSPLEADIDRFWQLLMDEVPVVEHRDMCIILRRKLDDLQKRNGW